MKFSIYKRGQGNYTRLSSAIGAAIVAALGCMQLYNKLQAAELGLKPRTMLWIATMIPAGLLAVLSVVVFWLVNVPTVADFMIAAEAEMKKVNWSSREEVAVSTFIVIMVVIIMAVMLGTTDMGFNLFFKWLLS